MANANPDLNIPRLSASRGVPALLAVLVAAVPLRAEEAVLTADFAVPAGSIRPLHGINKGPLAPGGIFDVIKEQKELGVPFTRLHDCGWPNPYVVDLHAVFPDPDADPAKPGSYDFGLTDEYIDGRSAGPGPSRSTGSARASSTRASSGSSTRPPTPRNGPRSASGSSATTTKGGRMGSATTSATGKSGTSPENRPAMWSGTRRRLPPALPRLPRRPSRSSSRR